MVRLEFADMETRIELCKPFAWSAELIAGHSFLTRAGGIAYPGLFVGFMVNHPAYGYRVCRCLLPPNLFIGCDCVPIFDLL